MLEEVVNLLDCKPGHICVDGTVGGGGHAFEILKRIIPSGILIGIDRDDDALAESELKLKAFGDCKLLVKGNFAEIGQILKGLNVEKVDRILLDLGVSSHQIETADRGFSFSKDAPLDMRMDREGDLTAFDIVNGFPEEELKRIIKDYGEEAMSGRIAKAISKRRNISPLETTGELAAVITDVLPYRSKQARIHPATKTFQALRIAVNDELANLHKSIIDGVDLLKKNGRFSIISFHSLEDRIVKNLFKSLQKGCICPPDFPVCVCGRKSKLKIITKRPVVPSESEIASNPRARSAKLRVAVRI
jgi:16S rRNA (cytosine1402-N4)-methyltransferase